MGGDTGPSWEMDLKLTPQEFTTHRGAIPASFREDGTSGLILRQRNEVAGWQVVTPETDKQLATFSTALAIVAKAADAAGFPEDVKNALPAAHKRLGLEFSTSQQRSA